jgi:phosphoenolpyruvate---glycerone phosphotransferase subunit DhaL
MGRAELTVAEAAAMFVYVAHGMEESVDILTQADKAIGDGDHGIGMARGFEAVRQKLEAGEPATLADVLRTVGMAIMTSTGGASGAVFGTLFRGGARTLGGQAALDAHSLALLLTDGLQAVQERGKARPGDKTMVDALEPAATAARGLKDRPVDEALAAAAEAARQGMEKTRDMVAQTGKAKTLGERALGHADPGAISMSLILKFMSEYTQGLPGEPAA